MSVLVNGVPIEEVAGLFDDVDCVINRCTAMKKYRDERFAGIAYTKSKGAVLFVIYDMAEGRNVTHLRSVQDEFLKNLMNELGGPNPVIQRSTVTAREVLEGTIVMAEPTE